jgi:glycosyltransferase involved in cell wall biosynthesis
MTARRFIIMLATAPETMGGISAVVNVYRQAGLFDRWPIVHIPTHCDGTRTRKTLFFVQAWFRFSAMLIAGRVGWVHAHIASHASFWRKMLFLIPAFLCHKSVLFHLHASAFPAFYENESGGRVGKWLIRYALRHAKVRIALASHWKRWLEQVTGLPVYILFNPVTIPRLQLNKQSPSPVLLFLGRLGAAKGVFDLLQATQHLVQSFPDLKLICAGDGDVEEVRQRAHVLGIGKNVVTPGWVHGNDKERLLSEAWIYVLPSYSECLPMSVLEAMAAGLPVVTTPVGGTPDAVTHGVEGLLVEPGNVASLEKSISSLLADKELRIRMGEAARQKAIELFSAERVVAQLESIYREIGAQPS